MKADTLHRDIDELLPWYANGTLEDDERGRIERHLASCEACRQEVALLRDVAETAADVVRTTPAGQDVFRNTIARIDEWESNQRPSLAARARGMLEGLVGASRVPRLVFAAQSALIVVLGAMLVLSRAQGPEFTTQSGGGAAPGVRLTVIFEPAATEESIRQALRRVDATVVSGPSAAGVYVVALPSVDGGSPAVDTAIAALRKNTSVIRFVEREP